MSSIGQDEHETLETLFQNVDLNLAETQARQCFHTTGPGRPPRNPLVLLRAFIVMRMKEIRSLRGLSRILNVDQRIRKLCLIKDSEKGYHRSVLSRFTTLVGAEKLRKIIDEKVVMLLRRSDVREVDVVLDASFIKAWSIRHPRDNRRGFSDPDARVGRHGRGYDLGYKLHVSVDHRRILPLASVLAPANDNEKRHGPSLVERTRELLRRAGARLRCLVADSQYSSGRMRGLVDEAVIPFMANQRRGEAVLRVARARSSWAGLAPRIHQSGGTTRIGRVGRGNKKISGLLVQCAHNARQHDPRFKRFYDRYHKRRGKGKALVAVAHEMIRIVYFMLRDSAPYRGQNVEMTTRKLKRMKYRASVGLQT